MFAERNKFQKSKKFTMIGLTTLTGDPVMCTRIMEDPPPPNGAIEAEIVNFLNFFFV